MKNVEQNFYLVSFNFYFPFDFHFLDGFSSFFFDVMLVDIYHANMLTRTHAHAHAHHTHHTHTTLIKQANTGYLQHAATTIP